MTKRAGLTGFRLLDGVVVASVALLGLKVLGVLSWVAAPANPAASESGQGFAHVLAHARTNYEPLDVATTGSVHEKPKDSPAPSAEAAPPPAPAATAKIVSPAERAILERLGERRDDLRQKDLDVEARSKLLEETEKRLDERFDELRMLQDKVEAAPKAETDVAALKNVVTMYETMKAKDAARVFDRLPQSVLVPVVLQMNPRKMGEILAAMSPVAAEKLTIALANRGQNGGAAAVSSATLPPGELQAIDPVPTPRR